MELKFSIIIPYYNVLLSFLECCLVSIKNQTYSNIEVILVDDGSNIDLSIGARQLAQRYRCVYIKTTNCGVSHARNEGLKLANGDFCMFVDPDDWLEKDACTIFAKIIKEEPNLDYIIAKNYIHKKTKKSQNFSLITGDCSIQNKSILVEAILKNENTLFNSIETAWGKVYSMRFLKKNHIVFDEQLLNSEDVLFNLVCVAKANNIYYSSKPIYNYRINENSACRVCANLDQKSIDSIQKVKVVLDKFGLDRNNIIFSFYIVRIICRLLRKYYFKYSYKEFKRKISRFLNQKIVQSTLKNCSNLDFSKHKKIVYKACINNQYFKLYLISKLRLNYR